MTPCSSRLEPTSVLHVADCGGRLFTAKLAVVVHYPTRQVFDQLLADHAILLACHFCDCLRDSVDDFICFSLSLRIARPPPGLSSMGGGSVCRRRRVCLRQQTTATRWRRQLPAGLLWPANATVQRCTPLGNKIEGRLGLAL